MKSSRMTESARIARRQRIMLKRERNRKELGLRWPSKGRYNPETATFGTSWGTCTEQSRKQRGRLYIEQGVLD